MPIYIALLRGINVSGQKIIPMIDLKSLFDKMGLKKAKTFIQSGNVIFEGDGTPASLTARIEKGIRKRFGFEVTVVLRSLPQLAKAVAEMPFKKTKEGEKVYITYLAESPSKEGAMALQALASPVDEIVLGRAEVYILIRGGYGKSIFSNTLVEKKLGVRATTRNLASSQKLIALASAP